MATISVSLGDAEARTVIATWANMTTGDVGEAVRYAGAADRTVQVVGTFGGATVTFQGSIDGTNWSNLTDAHGNDISMTATGIDAVTELVRFIRPSVSGGSGTSVTAMLLLRSA